MAFDDETPTGNSAEQWLKEQNSSLSMGDQAEKWLKKQNNAKENPEKKERLLDKDEVREQAFSLMHHMRQILEKIPAYNDAKNTQESGIGSETPFVVFTLGNSVYAVFDEIEDDGNESMVIKKTSSDDVSLLNPEDLQLFISKKENHEELLLQGFQGLDSDLESTISFEGPETIFIDAHGKEFRLPVINSTFAIEKAQTISQELSRYVKEPQQHA